VGIVETTIGLDGVPRRNRGLLVLPIPGGMGVAEAGLTAGLTAFGIPPETADLGMGGVPLADPPRLPLTRTGEPY
jgi:hypothetical protein